MKPYPLILFILLATCSMAQTQDPIVAANKCYEEKNYECAVGKYREALADKKYQEKDLATIKYRIGYGLKEQKKFTEAISMLKEVVAADANYGEAYWTLGWCYYSTKEYEDALENYSKAMPVYKDDKKSLASLHYGHGISNMGLYEYEDALDDFQTAIGLDNTVSNYYSYSGEATYNLGDFRESIDYYTKAISLGTTDSKATAARYYWVGQGHLELKEYEKAHIAFEKGLSFNPDNSSIHWGRAATYYNEKKYNEAIAAYNKAMNYYKDDTASLKEIYYWRGRCYVGLKDYAKAMSDYDAVLKIDPNYRDAHHQKAFGAYNQKKYKEAIPLFSNAITLYKTDKATLDDLYYFRGFCYIQLKDTVNAEKDFKESLSYNNNLREPNIFMGHISFSRKNYNEARNYYGKSAEGYITDTAEMARTWLRKGIANLLSADAYIYTGKEDLLKSIRYDSLNKEAHRYMADAYYRQSNFSMAEKELSTCIDLYKKVKDSLPRMYLYRGLARSQQKKYKEALSDYEQAEKSVPFTSAADVLVTGQLAFEIKDYDKATKIFTRLIGMYKPEQKNELVFAYFARGRSALELNKKEQATKDLKKALEFSPGNKEIEPWLAKAEALN